MLLVIDNYDSFTYNLVQLLAAEGAEVRVERNDALSVEEVAALRPRGIVLSPGPGRPEAAGICVELAASRTPVPLLGVCLGHQALAAAWGGRVEAAPRLMHGKTSEIRHRAEGLFAGIESPLRATRYHSLVVPEESLPPELEGQAWADDGTLQAIRHRELPHWGVQFHPESILTDGGPRLIANFLELCGVIEPAAALRRVIAGRDLSRAEMESLIGRLMDGELTEPVKAGLLVGLAAKGESVGEIAGAAAAMRQRVVAIPHHQSGVVDTCGTGGDGKGTFNVSTAAALIAAAAGVPVAKHGNRSVSSRSGSADVLEALGVPIETDAERAGRSLESIGIAFLFAPRLHPAVKEVMPVRNALGVRTLFNVLGPLTNPAGAPRQLLGVYSRHLVERLARVLLELGSEHALVVHGADGLDEITTTGETIVAELRHGEVRFDRLLPERFGLARASIERLRGGEPRRNAELMAGVLEGEPGPLLDISLLNAGAAIYVGGLEPSIEQGVERAREAVATGAAQRKLEQLRGGPGTSRDG